MCPIQGLTDIDSGSPIQARSLAAEGTTRIARTGFLLQLVHELEALVGLLMVKMVRVESLEKADQIPDNLKSFHKK